MAKLIALAAIAALFFSAGRFAGHTFPTGVASNPEHATQSISRTMSDPIVVADSSVTPVTSTDSYSHFFVSSVAPAAIKEVRSAELTEPTGEAESHELQDEEKRSAILKLIQRQFPDTDAEVAAIWADTYAEMDLDEISFILDQKRQISTGLGAAIMQPDHRTTTPMPEPLDCTPEPSMNIAVRIVQKNLRSVYSLGYCRMAVFPESMSDTDSLSIYERCDLPTTSFRSFESGPLIQSPIQTHIALAKSNSTMFRLDANRLTRRGDFQVLKNRRLGIVTRDEEMACAESTPIPPDATNIQIMEDSSIQFRNAAGDMCQAGRIAVCTVSNFAELQSTDGVIFDCLNADNLTIHDDAAGLLLTNALEQSNVDQTYENSLLTYLKSLCKTSF